MGYTRARRYANYKGGHKYKEDGSMKEHEIDAIKAESAAIVKANWDRIRVDEDYLKRKKAHQEKYG